MIFACLDIAQSRNIDAVWVDSSDRAVHHKQLPDSKSVVEWCAEFNPVVLAIDGPSKRNIGQTQLSHVRQQHKWKPGSYQDHRVCEALLRQRNIGLYNTSQQKPSGWIKAGWDVYKILQDQLGYGIWDTPGNVRIPEDKPTIIEVHPHACFVVGLGWIPPNKKTLPGQIIRIAYLHREGLIDGQSLTGRGWPDRNLLTLIVEKLQDASWDSLCERGVALPAVSHDRIDALGGLLTAIKSFNGGSYAVGEVEEGVIVLPSEPIAADRSYSSR